MSVRPPRDRADAVPRAPLLHLVAISLAVVAPLAGTAWAMFSAWTSGFMGWLYVNLAIAGWIVTGTGITIGYHRLLTHRSFETTPRIRACLVAMGALALQTSPLEWCAVHRRHHELSDQPGDPHSPHVHEPGFWNGLGAGVHAHLGWLFGGHLPHADKERYVPDLLKDRFACWIDRYYYPIWVPLSLLLPAAIAGVATRSWPGFMLGLLWGGLVRAFFVHHVTWSINSICHLFGSREFRTEDQSRNNLLCGVLGLGEGWHNNHHAFPTSARHGLRWWQLDVSYLVIQGLERLGLAWNVQLPSPQALARKSLPRGSRTP